eukprot:7587379-Pyramimonas_sp.AAC.1
MRVRELERLSPDVVAALIHPRGIQNEKANGPFSPPLMEAHLEWPKANMAHRRPPRRRARRSASGWSRRLRAGREHWQTRGKSR